MPYSEEELSAKCGIAIRHNNEQPPFYDRDVETDPFIQAMAESLTPQNRKIIKALNLSINVYSNLGERKSQETGIWGAINNIATTPSYCNPRYRSIYIGREYDATGAGDMRATQNTNFILMHEVAHVLDYQLGDGIFDRWGEGGQVSATRVFDYADISYELDRKPATELNPIQNLIASFSQSSRVRDGLFRYDDKGNLAENATATEIVCDLIAHRLCGTNTEEHKDLMNQYPHLNALADVMVLAGLDKKAQERFVEMAREKTPLIEVIGEIRRMSFVQNRNAQHTPAP